MQGRTFLHCFAKLNGADALPLTGGLHIGGMRRAVIAEDDGQPAHALPADEADLDLCGFFLARDNGGEAGFREVDCIDALVRLFEDMPKREAHSSKMRLQKAEIGRGQRCKKKVARRRRSDCGHGSIPVGQEHIRVSQPSAPGGPVQTVSHI